MDFKIQLLREANDESRASASTKMCLIHVRWKFRLHGLVRFETIHMR